MPQDAHPAGEDEVHPGAGGVLLEEREPGRAVDLLARGEPVAELPGREEPEQGVAGQELLGHVDGPAISRSKVAWLIRPASQAPNNSSWMRCRVAPSSSAGARSSTTTRANPSGVATGPTSSPVPAEASSSASGPPRSLRNSR